MIVHSTRTIAACCLAILILAFNKQQAIPQQPKAPTRIELIPLFSDSLLQDIQESPDHTRLITHDRGYGVRLWDPKTMRILRVLGSRNEAIPYVIFSWSGDCILTVSQSAVSIWDSLHAKRRVLLAPLEGETFASAALSRDSKWCVVGTSGGKLGIFSVADPKNIKWVVAHKDAILSLDFSSDGSRLVSASEDLLAKVWSMPTCTPIATLSGHTKAVRWAWFSEDAKQVLTTGRDDTGRLYDASNGKVLLVKPHYIGERSVGTTLMSAIFVGAMGEGVLFASQNGEMPIYDRLTGNLIKTLKGHTDVIREIRKSRDGTKIGTYADDGKLKLWDYASGKELPFTLGNGLPSAGDFSPEGDVFWVGYGDGSIRRHELATGRIRTATLGDMYAFDKAVLSPNGHYLWLKRPTEVDLVPSFRSEIRRIDDPSHPIYLPSAGEAPTFSPDGTHMFMWNPEHRKLRVFDLEHSDSYTEIASPSGAVYSADGSRILTWNDRGGVSLWDGKSAKKLDSITLEKTALDRAIFVDDDKYFIGLCKNGIVQVWDAATLNGIRTFDTKIENIDSRFVLSPDGKYIALNHGHTVDLWNFRTDQVKVLTVEKDPENYSFQGDIPRFSSDSKYLVLSNGYFTYVWDIETGVKKWKHSSGSSFNWSTCPNASATGHLVALPFKSEVQVWDYEKEKLVSTAHLADLVGSAGFDPTCHWLYTADPTGGFSIWDITKPDSKRLGMMVTMNDGGWLATDSEGRYDSNDPSHVEGASYVMEWSGGLEPISVSQLKGQFYDPSLLAKLMGIEPTPLRQVPDLGSLHLFPSVELKTNKDKKIDILLHERDQGGIGKVVVYLNRKQVMSREGTGYIVFDPAEYERFMLPQQELKDQGNLLAVQVTNEEGSLVSPLETLDLGVPASMKAPDVNMFVLCVGVGDYAGNTKDLSAPPKDATDLSLALFRVADRLLPGKVHVTTMTTGAADTIKPTRPNILKWLADTASKASSSDIIFVSLSGHGTSAIGSKQDYFFLTMESDPAEVNPATATTGAISGDELRTALAKISATKQVVILDTCHSGAATKDLVNSRSVGGEYQRAWESIKDGSGTWLLAGTAADQLSYEASNVDHGILTYALLEAIDQASPEGLRKADDGQLFVDVQQWLTYAVTRVDTLKNEVGISGIQRPELKHSASNASFALGIAKSEDKGFIGLKAPMPIVIVGTFQKDEEDPAGVEPSLAAAFHNAKTFKAWMDVPKHPNVYRVAGTYQVNGTDITVKVLIQWLDAAQSRKTIDTFEISGSASHLDELAATIVKDLDVRINALESKRKNPQ